MYVNPFESVKVEEAKVWLGESNAREKCVEDLVAAQCNAAAFSRDQ